MQDYEFFKVYYPQCDFGNNDKKQKAKHLLTITNKRERNTSCKYQKWASTVSTTAHF